MPDFGPFSVNPARVTALGGANFGQFIGRLLATEAVAHGMAGTTLETTYLENIGDGGVDAGLRDATGTSWPPSGDSAWQFKAGGLTPAKCKAEFEGATKAIEILRAGGTYRLVLGASLTSAKIAARRNKLIEAATSLGIAAASSRIDVIAADGLARWIETYPALAVSPLLGGIGRRVLTFKEWSDSHPHETLWTGSRQRDSEIEALRSSIASGTPIASRIEGVSGLGKSRLTLEAVRGQDFESLVIYAPAADQFPIDLLIQMRSQDRVGVVVIDECDRKEHEIFASTLAVDSSIRIVTIGEPGNGSTRSPILNLSGFGDEGMHELLRANRSNLSAEAKRVVVQIAAGNIDYALKLAQTTLDAGPGVAGRLVTEGDIRAFFTDQLPDGQLFLAGCALALFSRFGLDGEPAQEIDVICAGLGISAENLRNAATELQLRRMLSKQGRYRSVGPHPVAVYLAARGWTEFGQKIVVDLLPVLDPDLTERLFRRAADVGELDSGRSAILAVRASDGPLASLDSIAEGKNSDLLVHFAVLAPATMTDRLAELIAAASEDDLMHARGIRRDLVWALEKLAWHSKTFVAAADALLRLSIAENESYSNNASGTWIEFFATMLPGTAAMPDLRMTYLQGTAMSHDPRVRLMAARGANRALDPHETIMVSGEVQGGVVVETSGTPATLVDAWICRNSAIDVLATLTTDADENVVEEASKHLIDSVHGPFETPVNRDHLGRTIARLSPEVIARARIQIEGLRSLFDWADTQDGRPAALAELEALLPAEKPMDRLTVLVNARTWDRKTDSLTDELVENARLADIDDPIGVLLQLLVSISELPAAYAIGQAIRLLGLGYNDGITRLSSLAGTANGEALIGFLRTLMNEGDVDAFDRYLDGANLPALVTLQYSVRGARSPAAAARVDRLLPRVTVTESARVLFTWMHDADQADSARYLRQWESRIETQADYNAAIDFAAMQVFRKAEPLADLDPAIADLVRR